MKKEDAAVLNQLVKSLEEAGSRLEEAYDRKDSENFEKMKKFISGVQSKISEILK